MWDRKLERQAGWTMEDPVRIKSLSFVRIKTGNHRGIWSGEVTDELLNVQRPPWQPCGDWLGETIIRERGLGSEHGKRRARSRSEINPNQSKSMTDCVCM